MAFMKEYNARDFGQISITGGAMQLLSLAKTFLLGEIKDVGLQQFSSSAVNAAIGAISAGTGSAASAEVGSQLALSAVGNILGTMGIVAFVGGFISAVLEDYEPYSKQAIATMAVLWKRAEERSKQIDPIIAYMEINNFDFRPPIKQDIVMSTSDIIDKAQGTYVQPRVSQAWQGSEYYYIEDPKNHWDRAWNVVLALGLVPALTVPDPGYEFAAFTGDEWWKLKILEGQGEYVGGPVKTTSVIISGIIDQAITLGRQNKLPTVTNQFTSPTNMTDLINLIAKLGATSALPPGKVVAIGVAQPVVSSLPSPIKVETLPVVEGQPITEAKPLQVGMSSLLMLGLVGVSIMVLLGKGGGKG
jgi:hypothetical protein